MILFSNKANKASLSRQEKSGKLVKLCSGVYSNDTETDIAVQVRAHAMKILHYLRPECVISHISALKHDCGVSDGAIYITVNGLTKNYTHTLPGLEIHATNGPAALENDAKHPDGVAVASKGRAILECLESRKSETGRVPSSEVMLDILNKMASTTGSAASLSSIATHVNSLSGRYWDKELGFLNQDLSNIKVQNMKQGASVDTKRISLFEELAVTLQRGIYGNDELYGDQLSNFPSKESIDDFRFRNLAFYASYFSNYIEGTEFTPEEAKEVIEGLHPDHAAKDGHDITALNSLYLSTAELRRTDDTADAFIDNLKHWHAVFGDHKDKESIRPGQFKNEANRAGNTWFTEPHLVENTLRKSWDIGRSLTEPSDLAIYRAVSTVAIHPFNDGNGRITRFAAANVLARSDKIHFIIPNVFREDYILAMQAFSNGDVVPVIRMYKRALELTQEIPWHKEWQSLTKWLQVKNAFCNPHEAKWGGPPPEKPTDVSGIRI